MAEELKTAEQELIERVIRRVQGWPPDTSSTPYQRWLMVMVAEVVRLRAELDAVKHELAANRPIRESGTATAKCGGFAP